METIFQGVWMIWWKIVSVSKEPNVLLFSFLATVALKINYFHLNIDSNIVDRYTAVGENKLNNFFIWFEICEPVTEFIPSISKLWNSLHIVCGHAF